MSSIDLTHHIAGLANGVVLVDNIILDILPKTFFITTNNLPLNEVSFKADKECGGKYFPNGCNFGFKNKKTIW